MTTVKSQARHALDRLRVLAPELVVARDEEDGAPVSAVNGPEPASAVLDVERIDDLASRAMSGRTVDLLDVTNGFVAPSSWSHAEVSGPVLVSADGAQYRRLPGGEAHAVSLADDGRQVAWSPGQGTSTGTSSSDVLWVSTSGGETQRVSVAVAGQPAQVGGTSWSPDGRWIAVWGLWADTAAPQGSGAFSGELGLSVIDTRSGRATPICQACSTRVAFDGQGRLLLDLPRDSRPQALPRGLRVGSFPGEKEPTWNSMLSARPLVSPDGHSVLGVSKAHQEEVGPLDDYSVVVTDSAGRSPTGCRSPRPWASPPS